MGDPKQPTMDWNWTSTGDAGRAAATRSHSGRRRPLVMATAELQELWLARISRAEGPGGLHAFLCTASPRYLPMVSYFRRRHRTLLGELARLRWAAERATPTSSWLSAEYGRLARDIVLHDEIETEVLCDALTRD